MSFFRTPLAGGRPHDPVSCNSRETLLYVQLHLFSYHFALALGAPRNESWHPNVLRLLERHKQQTEYQIPGISHGRDFAAGGAAAPRQPGL